MTESIHNRAYEEQVPHQHVPGRAYEAEDAATRLIHTIGGGFFNEPKYYDSNRPPAAFYAELAATGKISSIIVDQLGLTEQAREVIETAQAVAYSLHPDDLLVIATWARDPREGLKLRTTPAVLLALAAANDRTKRFVARYAPDILRRADEIRVAFATFRHLFQAGVDGRHRGALPHSLRKGLAAALAKCSDYELLKYNDANRPTFADVLKMVGGSRKLPGRKASGWPVSRALFEYLVNGIVTDDAPPILQARKRFFATKDAAVVTPALVREAGLTWENVVSHLGSSAAVWELVIPFMGEMALTRNLRNFEQAGISPLIWQKVRDRLLAVEETVQLPFRFFAAEREVSSPDARDVVRRVLDRACTAVVDLPGTTLVLTDNSGSAVGCAVSGALNLRVADAGNMLGAILARRLGPRVLLGVFGDSLIWVPCEASDDCLAIKKRMDDLALREERSRHGALAIPAFASGFGVGQSTETGLWWGLHDVTQRKVWIDRILLISDLCCYTQGDINCGYDMSRYFGARATVQSMVDQYRRAVNPQVFVYSINLNGHEQSQLRPGGERTHLLSGWSEQVFRMARDLEAGAANRPTQAAAMPTIETLRVRYRR
jgi:hypothetical protein